jgi:hypothetical protein
MEIQFNWEIFNKMFQFSKIAKDQGLRIKAETLRNHFEIPDREARYYHFLIKNVDKFQPNFWNVRTENRLIIPDIHAPFVKKGFLEHCIKTYYQFNCTKVTFLGDVIDNNYSSRYVTNPDGLSAKSELDLAITTLKPWFDAFPDAEVCIGNHDDRIRIKAFEGGISTLWLREFKDVLQVPGWNFKEDFEHFDVLYVHGHGPGGGENGCYMRVLNWRRSVVQGHWHTSSYTRWTVSNYDRLFAFQLGCGIDHKAYAMAYAKMSKKKPIIECGVILDNGKIPIHLPMYL